VGIAGPVRIAGRHGMRVTTEIIIELDIDFDVVKAELTTRHYPGHPEYIEINSILLYGVELPGEITNKILADMEDELMEACRDEVKENEYERAVDRYEDKVLSFVKNNINRQTGLKI
jgi:phosphomannomutase